VQATPDTTRTNRTITRTETPSSPTGKVAEPIGRGNDRAIGGSDKVTGSRTGGTAEPITKPTPAPTGRAPLRRTDGVTPPPADAGKTAPTIDRTLKTSDALRKDSTIRATPAPSDTTKTDTGNKTTRDYTADRSRQDLQPKNTTGNTTTTGRTDRSSIATPTVKADRDTALRVDKNTPVKINDSTSAPGKAARDSRGTAPDRTIASGHTPVARPIQVNQNPATDNNSSNGTSNPQININGNNNNVYVNGGDVNVSHNSGGYGHNPRYYHGYYPTPYHTYRHNTLILSFGWNTDWYYDSGAYYLDSPWDSCGRIVSVPWHGAWGVTYYYPSYHRNFMFVSLGGYWPNYSYRRYYWYGCHPYRWYDYDVAYDTMPVSNTYYTTNNYYTTEPSPSSGYQSQYFDDFSDVRQKLQREQQQQQLDQAQDKPNNETSADRNFSEAVSAFGLGDYNDAALKFRVAMVLEPKDIILPFAYAQTLFAKGDYDAAAATLRSVLISMVQPVEAGVQKDQGQETVYYPRGLYKKEEVLQQQIAALAAKVAANPNDTDLQLLLGYQLLGSGQADKSLIPLGEAAKDPANREPVRILLNLREKVLEDQKTAAGTVASPVGLSAAPAVNAATDATAKKDGQ
jgi:tetratricopeptide (TPR) repeat protein